MLAVMVMYFPDTRIILSIFIYRIYYTKIFIFMKDWTSTSRMPPHTREEIRYTGILQIASSLR
jgi:hypothetical protein